MERDEIVMVCCSDIAGQVRGKGFPARLLAERERRGVGWTPTNAMITAHGAIADGPWGALGDLVLLPAMDSHVRVDFGDDSAATNFVLADICDLDGGPWDCCLRNFLRRGLAALAEEFGLRLKAAFEHELHYDQVDERPNAGYALDAFRRQGRFGEVFLGGLRQAGVTPDTFMPEYGPQQYEVTVEPAVGLAAADQAVILREVARGAAQHLGGRASFTPILRPDAVGNGVHVHFSLLDRDDRPATHDGSGTNGLSAAAAAFAAGVTSMLPDFLALTAAATVSYLRLTPHRWSAAFNNLGRQDREAALRICPVFETTGNDVAGQFHLEFRAADAAASPYALLAAIVWAGVHGLRRNLSAPPVTHEDLAGLSASELTERGLERLPQSLAAALDRMAGSGEVRAWMGPALHDAYLCHKRFEVGLMDGLDDAAQCARYYQAY